MGLDTVEFVLDIEKEFAIEITDSEAERLGVVRDIADYIEVKRRESGQELSHQYILNKIIEILVVNYAVPRDEISERSHVVYDLNLD